jgi:hypothetical protein
MIVTEMAALTARIQRLMNSKAVFVDTETHPVPPPVFFARFYGGARSEFHPDIQRFLSVFDLI